MRVLVSEGTSRMGRALLQRLSGEHSLRVARPPGAEAPDAYGIDVLDADLCDLDGARTAVDGVDAIVHTGPAGPPALPPEGSYEGERALLDRATRGTRSLLQAAVDARVPRLVYCSSLEVFHEVPDDEYVSEQHRPRPGTAMKRLAYHLAEQVTREFAREHFLTVTVLRLGRLQCEDRGRRRRRTRPHLGRPAGMPPPPSSWPSGGTRRGRPTGPGAGWWGTSAISRRTRSSSSTTAAGSASSLATTSAASGRPRPGHEEGPLPGRLRPGRA